MPKCGNVTRTTHQYCYLHESGVERSDVHFSYSCSMSVSYSWRGDFTNAALNELHAEAFNHRPFDDDWWTQVNRYSLGWICAKEGEDLAGFLNVLWDGGVHAFLLDTMVTTRLRGRGIGKKMVDISVREIRAAGCEWLHVDFEDHLRGYYFGRCGFKPTNAGLIALK